MSENRFLGYNRARKRTLLARLPVIVNLTQPKNDDNNQNLAKSMSEVQAARKASTSKKKVKKGSPAGSNCEI